MAHLVNGSARSEPAGFVRCSRTTQTETDLCHEFRNRFVSGEAKGLQRSKFSSGGCAGAAGGCRVPPPLPVALPRPPDASDLVRRVRRSMGSGNCGGACPAAFFAEEPRPGTGARSLHKILARTHVAAPGHRDAGQCGVQRRSASTLRDNPLCHAELHRPPLELGHLPALLLAPTCPLRCTAQLHHLRPVDAPTIAVAGHIWELRAESVFAASDFGVRNTNGQP